MSEATNKHLGDWINAFYIAEALSDDLTSGCSAQEFHLLVPTLLRQSVLAFAKGRLSSEALKTGLECRETVSDFIDAANTNRSTRTLSTAVTCCSIRLDLADSPEDVRRYVINASSLTELSRQHRSCRNTPHYCLHERKIT